MFAFTVPVVSVLGAAKRDLRWTLVYISFFCGCHKVKTLRGCAAFPHVGIRWVEHWEGE